MSNGWSNPQEAIAVATLPLLSAWTDPVILLSANAVEGVLMVSYERGGAAGAVEWRMNSSIYSVNSLAPAGQGIWAVEMLWTAAVAAAGVLSVNLVTPDVQQYTALTAAQEVILYPFTLGGNVERISLTARETGNAGAPGDCGIVVQMRT